MNRSLILLAGALALAGCFRDTTLVNLEAGAVDVVPPRVLNALPEGVTSGDVLILDGCYFYRRGFEAIPITRPEEPTSQICLIF